MISNDPDPELEHASDDTAAGTPPTPPADRIIGEGDEASRPAPPGRTGPPVAIAADDPNDDEELVPIEWVCERYKLKRRDVLAMVDEGSFPPGLRLSERRWRFRRRDVDEWEAGRWVGKGDLTARAKTAGSTLRRPADARPGAPATPASRRPGAG